MFRIQQQIIALFYCVSVLVGFCAELPKNVSIQREAAAWVERIAPEYETVLPEGGVANGVYYLLTDQQVYPEQETDYRHYAYRLTSASGVEDNSSVSVTIDPDYERLVWHQIDIIRDGVRMDQLSKQAFRASVNQDSYDLIYDNSMNCLAIIPGTKKGDVIEYAYSVIGRNPITDDRYTEWFSLDYSVPVARIFIRVVRELRSRPLQFRLQSSHTFDQALPVASLEDGLNNYRFELRDVAPIHADGNVPDDYMVYSYLQVSDWLSWREVSEWGVKLYHYNDVEIQLPDELAAQMSEWQALADPKMQALAALDWVQEEIRYVGIMIGPHNYKPYQIEQTLERGFGDCKDKTQLLCYLLGQLGIKATPTLVNTVEKGLIRDYLPSASSFDHVVTQVDIAGETYWLDPTNSSQGGTLDTMWFPDFVAGLELSMGTDDLMSVSGQGASESRSFVREVFSMKAYNADIDFTVYSRYFGSEADSQRRYFNGTMREEAQKDFLNYYAKQFPEIKAVAALEYTDDLHQNVVEIVERYTISNGWVVDEDDPSKTYLYTYPKLIDSSLFVSDTRIRSMPAAQFYPLDFTQVIEVILPEGGDFENEDYRIDTPWFESSGSVSTEGDKLTLEYTYKNLLSRVPAEDYAEYAKQVDAVSDALGYSISYYDADVNIAVDEDRSFEHHYASYLSAAFFGLLGLVLSGWIVSRKKAPPKPPLYMQLDGISGWLVLPMLGVCFAPFTLLYSLIDQIDYFNRVWVEQYTLVSGDTYIPGFELLLLAETGFNFFCLVLSITMIYVLFKKRAVLPAFYIGYSIFMTVGICVDLSVTNHLFTSAGFDGVEGLRDMIWTTIGTVVWSIYFSVSDRVKSTFRN